MNPNFNLELLIKYPLMFSRQLEIFTLYEGYINVNDEDYEINVTENTVTKEFTIKLVNSPTSLDTVEVIDEVMKTNPSTIIELLNNLRILITNKTTETILRNNTEIYRKLIYEYSEFTKFIINVNKCELSRDLKKIYIEVPDEKNRIHFLEISIDYDEISNIFYASNFDLPESGRCKNIVFAKSNCLTTVYNQFLGYVEMFQPFWDTMESLDNNCFILDPKEPKKCHNYRRIFLGDNASVVLIIDPFNISLIPEIRFLGPEEIIQKYRETVNDNLKNWNFSSDIYQEILNLLGLEEFPQGSSKLTVNADILKNDDECSICFSLMLDDCLPDIICKNECCQNFYHSDCLYEWLTSVNAKRVFDSVYGQCPNCEKQISCPISNKF